MTDCKFKVGDEIEIIDKELVPQDVEIGNGIISGISNESGDSWSTYTFENGYTNSYKPKHLKLISAELRRGDRVIISVPRNHPYWEYDEKEGRISRIHKNILYGIYVDFEGVQKVFSKEEVERI